MSSSSPTRSAGEDGDLDLDSVQAALRNFQQEFRDTQRERVGHMRTHTHTPPRHFNITIKYLRTL